MISINKNEVKKFQNLHLWLEEKRLIKLFNYHKINIKSFKGLGLLKELSDDFLLLKSVSDIDFLIASKSVSKAVKILTDSGYALIRIPKVSYQEYLFLHPKRGISIELHQTVLNFDRSRFIDKLFLPFTEYDIKRLNKIILNKSISWNQPLYITILTLHYALHHCFCGIDRLFTIKLVLSKYSENDWQEVTKYAIRHKLRIYFIIIFDLIEKWSDLKVIKYLTALSTGFSTNLYRRIFFLILSKNIVWQKTDSPNPMNYREKLLYTRTVQFIKIICSDQSLSNKLTNFVILVFSNFREIINITPIMNLFKFPQSVGK